MKILKQLLIILLLVQNCLPAISQDTTARQQVLQLLKQVNDQYTKAGAIEMSIRYFSANEHTPNVYFDSVRGSLTMQGNQLRMTMDAVETIVNDRYSITLFGEDHLMYLAKPANAQKQHPLAAINMTLQQLKDVRFTILQKGTLTEALVDVDGDSPYKTVSFTVDTTTHYLLASRMLVKTAYMAPGADSQTLRKDGYGDYTIVETKLSGYKTPLLPADYFDEKRFFTRKDNQFEVTEPYRDYKIFVATPNL